MKKLGFGILLIVGYLVFASVNSGRVQKTGTQCQHAHDCGKASYCRITAGRGVGECVLYAVHGEHCNFEKKCSTYSTCIDGKCVSKRSSMQPSLPGWGESCDYNGAWRCKGMLICVRIPGKEDRCLMEKGSVISGNDCRDSFECASDKCTRNVCK